MKKSTSKNWISTVSILAAVSLIATACGGKEETPKEGEASASAAPVNITWTTPLYTQSVPKDTVLKLIEEKVGAKFDITWVPDAVKEDKLNTALASGTLTKIVAVQDIKMSSFQSAVKAGMFWEIGPLLKDYPNLNKVNPTTLGNIKINGKVYGIPRERPLSRQGIVVRQDWLSNLGLQQPKTIDDLYNVLKAFTLSDPDKNGKNDTFGLTERNDLKFGAFKTVSSYFGTPNEWGLKDGKLVPEFMFPQYIETMKFFNKLYKEKLMNDDFAVTSKTQQWEKFSKGQAGLYVGNMVDGKNLYNDSSKINPNVKIDIFNRIAGPDGKEAVWAQAGHNGIFVFPKTSIKTEDELKQILAVMDKMNTVEVFNLMRVGIEGVHHKLLGDGKFEEIAGAKDAFEQEVRPLDSIIGLDLTNLKAANDPLREKYEALTLDNAKMVVANPAEALVSDTLTIRGTELKKIIDDATIKLIMGQLDEAGFQSEVTKWQKNGGDKIIEELNASYTESK
ncbi:extracellular solute-binding protein [Paenibacillus sp. 5J-6]|uniref:Extracellular solute-binding protein n=1 Tax=Paenibacillus silvestris TaxID=2606219 RepID=A0A6L8URQ3_9BACL|nr:extracellular solute-binding protein [Paenibacillus silvestris]MZQ80617.1 extracellular solute-binding protein [Paenibacillus silvestris]